MIFEVTQDYAVIVPLMISNLVSLFISSRLQRQPIYEALAIQDGIHLPTAESRQRSPERQVARIMRPPTESLAAGLTLREALQHTHASKFRTWIVMDNDGVAGVINQPTLEQQCARDAGQRLGKTVSALSFPHVHSDHSLEVALERLGANRLDVIPVVNRANIHKLEGVVTLQSVLNAYGIASP